MTPLQRRQFGKLVAASLTSTIIADISSKALAQSGLSNEILYTVNVPKTSDTSRNKEDQSPVVELNTANLPIQKVLSANLLDQKVFSKVNLPVLSVDNLSPVPRNPQAFFSPDPDRIAKAIVLADKTLVIATVSNTKNGHFNHLIYSVGSPTNGKFKAKKVLDFKNSNQTLESLVRLPNQILCLVGTRGVPPFSLVTLDFGTGKILSENNLSLPALSPSHRFANLCYQALSEEIFATEVGHEGVPVLISMKLNEKAIVTGKLKITRREPLTIKGNPLIGDVKDFGFNSSGQLYALAANSSRKNNLYTVDVKTGTMELVTELAAEKFVFAL